MNNHTHTMNELFQQLGLPSDDRDIQEFVKTHHVKDVSQHLDQASFWSPSQAGFIKESWHDDSEWCLTIDDLDARLRA